MDLTTIIIIGAFIITAITLSIIIFDAIRIFWSLTPNWLRLTIGSILALGVIIIVIL